MKSSARTSIGEYLIRRLHDHGVRHVDADPFGPTLVLRAGVRGLPAAPLRALERALGRRVRIR